PSTVKPGRCTLLSPHPPSSTCTIAILFTLPRPTRSFAAWKSSVETFCRTIRICKKSSRGSNPGNKWSRTRWSWTTRSLSDGKPFGPTLGGHREETGDDSRSRRFCAEQQVCGAGRDRSIDWLGDHFISQFAGGSVSRYRRQLRDGHYPMAGAFRGRGGTAGHDSHRNANGRNAAHDLSAIRVHFRSVVRDHDLRRQFRQRLEPPEGAGKAHPGQSPQRTKPSATNRHGLEHHGPDLLVHAEKHQS